MSTVPTMPTNTPTLTTAEAFDLLGNVRRRSILRSLPTDGESISIRTLTLTVSFQEIENRAVDQQGVDARRYKRTLTSLFHSDLPKMADAAAIEYDEEERTVRRGPVASELERFLP